jgi:hypothetical protein
MCVLTRLAAATKSITARLSVAIALVFLAHWLTLQNAHKSGPADNVLSASCVYPLD